jgi:hypothetical protein
MSHLTRVCLSPYFHLSRATCSEARHTILVHIFRLLLFKINSKSVNPWDISDGVSQTLSSARPFPCSWLRRVVRRRRPGHHPFVLWPPVGCTRCLLRAVRSLTWWESLTLAQPCGRINDFSRVPARWGIKWPFGPSLSAQIASHILHRTAIFVFLANVFWFILATRNCHRRFMQNLRTGLVCACTEANLTGTTRLQELKERTVYYRMERKWSVEMWAFGTICERFRTVLQGHKNVTIIFIAKLHHLTICSPMIVICTTCFNNQQLVSKAFTWLPQFL